MAKPGLRSETDESRPRNAVGVFFTSWLRNPRKVASIVPSSRRLAAAVARQIDPNRPGWVIELGGGTGAITDQLLARGIPPKRLMVVERDPVMAAFLRERYPDPLIVEGDALKLRDIVRRHDDNKVHAVVCGLPLLGMPREFVDGIMEEALAIMEPDAQFFQYTYSLFSPLQYKRYGLKPERVVRVALNIPPASVWQYRKIDAANRKAAA